MSTTDDVGGSEEAILTARERRAAVVLPIDPTDEELARDWTLSERDLAEVNRCRGGENRLRFAIQLTILRKFGRLLEDYAAVRQRILVHLNRQIGGEAIEDLFLRPPARGATETEQQDRLRTYLGWRPFDGCAQEQLERWLVARATEGGTPRELYDRAEATLRSWKIVLPAPGALERLVASAASKAESEIFGRIAGSLSPEIVQAIDELLEVSEGDQRSTLFRLKEYPPEAKPPVIASYLDRYAQIARTGIDRVAFEGLSASMIEHLAKLAKAYDVWRLKRFAPPKRYALVAAFLAEAGKTILDHVVEMHDECLTVVCRKSRRDFEERLRLFRRRDQEGRQTIFGAMDILLDPNRPRKARLEECFLKYPESSLRAVRDHCREFARLEERGELDHLTARYAHLRRYLPAFWALPFEAESGSAPLLEALALVRKLDAGELAELPSDPPDDFVPEAWRRFLEREDGTLDRAAWEIALALAAKDALRSGDFYLPRSRVHVSFSNMVYDDRNWAQARSRHDTPFEPELAKLREELAAAKRPAVRDIRKNPFAAIEGGRLKLKREDALEIPESVRELKRTLQSHFEKTRIEDALMEADELSGFSREFRPLGGYEPRSENLHVALLAAIIAHGTNLGMAAMGASAEGVTVDMLSHVSRWFLREETLKAANAALVNAHHALPISSVWGDGSLASADGQRFRLRKSSLLGSVYPRYFGYYDRAVTVYTHIFDQHSVFSTKVISCHVREALWVLDGLLENNTVLSPRGFCVDTHGYVEILFGLCRLLGFSFMPRIADLADQQLYKIDRADSFGPLEGLFKGAVDVDLIREQWEPILRVKASLADRVTPAHVIVQRLLSSSPSDRLKKALTAYGRIPKTTHILRYIQDPELRRPIQLQLNRGESRQSLGRRIFFADRGEFSKPDYEEIMNKASCLSLLSNAVLLTNTVKIANTVERLRATGQTIRDEDLARVSPLMWEHIIPTGTYHFRRGIETVQSM